MIIDKVPLRKIAHARSGDKGSDANIGVIAYSKEGYEYLKEYLSEEIVKEYFQSLGVEEVKRYDIPNLHSFNFVLKQVLQGGGSLNLRNDSQGKTLGTDLLELTVPIDEATLAKSQRC